MLTSPRGTFDVHSWPQSSLLLNQSLLERGVELQGDDSRLACARAALSGGSRLTTAAIGGSITAGSSYGVATAAADFLWHNKVTQALNALYPVAGGHAHTNGGVPGTGPTYMEHCVHDHLPPSPSLIMLEYAVNVDRRKAAFERLMRKILLTQPQAALVVVNAHRWRVVRSHDGRTDKCWTPKWPVDMVGNRTQRLAQTFGNEPGATDAINADEDAVAALCRHYNVPLVSQRAALVDAVRLGEIGIPSFMRDCKHPAGEGHTHLAQLVLQRLLHPPQPQPQPATPPPVTTTTTTGAAQCGEALPARAALPPPLNSDGLEQASSVCARGAQLATHVTARSGFELSDEGRGPHKLGYVATAPGATISLAFDLGGGGGGRGGGRGERQAALWIGFLRSYEHMGRVAVSCSGGCGCDESVIDGHDIVDGVSVTDVRRVMLTRLRPRRGKRKGGGGEEARMCSVGLRVKKASTSGEHKFKLMSVLLGGHDASSLQTFSMRVAASAAEGRGGGQGGGGKRRGRGKRGGRGGKM